jgi:hypothetical protein
MRVSDSSAAILEAVRSFIDQQVSDGCCGGVRATLLNRMAEMAFDPEMLASVMAPIKGWKLMQDVAAMLPDTTFFLLSNYNGEAYDAIAAKWPQLFAQL